MMAPYNPGPRLELPPRAELLASLRQGLLIAAALLVLLLPPTGLARFGHKPANAARPAAAAGPQFADFKGAAASGAAQWLAHWVRDSGDSRLLPFVILDKRDARVFVFDAQGRLLGATHVLLGAAAGVVRSSGLTSAICRLPMPATLSSPAASMPRPAATPWAKTCSGSTTTPPCPCTGCVPPNPAPMYSALI
eukprot:Opistho-2@27493